MQWHPQPTIDELVARLRAAKEMRVSADTIPARDLSYLSDPDLIRRMMSDDIVFGDDPSEPIEQTPKRKRRASRRQLARLAKKEGVEIKLAPDGTITMTPVKPVDVTLIDDTASGSEWDSVLQ